ncbi:hypothetical protein GQ43DRAFT_458675 [Delitschia confertaspora ATCC 74209]|uniref:Uncharacterized protein n=1 Tax=Delitschia confertaspora ATCC 74209 TaxID=1513339 RepID=A0A9P4JIL4_9PLEO|nr:hypothetical protein GQ43DRAFT_458675 [Delitschia confertaspora ATCC 74209]
MSAMEALEAQLQSLPALKPPGATKAKIEAITALCINNIQSDSIIVQKIFQQFKRSPATHKLGVLYVLDSVTRQWVEKARQSNQVVSHKAAEGTFASGVQKVTDLLPTLVNELIQTAPENHREKISKLLDIWERGQTFPLEQLRGFKQKLTNLQQASVQSHTPPGSPPKSSLAALNITAQPPASQASAAPTAPAAVDPVSILTALANYGKQISPTAFQTAQAAPSPFGFQQNIAAPPLPFVPPPPALPTGQTAPPAPTGGQDMMTQLFQAIAAGLIPPDQAMQLMAAVAAAQNANGTPVVPPFPVPSASIQPPSAVVQPPAQQNGVHANNENRYRPRGGEGRSRSRSPGYGRRRATPNRGSPPNRRNSPTYAAYDPNAVADGSNGNRNDYERGRGRGRNRGRNEYRQRTPPRRQPSPGVSRGMQPKFLEYDNSLPPDTIRVLSRTLFVGGANGSEAELRSIFSRFGTVQTCIVNRDKHHAFVKMVNRKDALAAKEGMDKCQDPDMTMKARQTRWGVGFGPRDCSDYTTGISIIPIARLTEADKKWVVQAEYGGTGGKPLEGGMVIEEPDIEIGAGVSSKAISRRVPPHVPNPGRGGGSNFAPRGHDNGPRNRKQERAHEARHMSPRSDAAIGVPPPVPGFGFQLPGF